MKFRATKVLLMAALTALSVAVSGCGSSGTDSGTGVPGGPGAPAPGPGYGGAVTPIPGGGIQINFTDAQAYYSGVRINSNTSGFWGSSGSIGGMTSTGTMTLGGGALVGSTATLTGTSPFYAGTTIVVAVNSAGSSLLRAAITGTLTLSPDFVMRAFGSTVPSVQGLAIDLYPSSPGLSGSAYVCTGRNSMGACYGPRVDF